MNFKCFAAERASESDSITNEDSSDNQISMNQNTTTAHDGATTIKTQDDKGKDVQDELSDVNVTVDWRLIHWLIINLRTAVICVEALIKIQEITKF